VTQSKHPPLYHALAAALTAWTGLDFTFLRSNPDALPLGPDKPPNLFIHTTLESFPWRGGALAMHLARLLSVALGGITVWGAWRLGRESFPDRPAIGLLAAAFLAGLPGFLFISGSVNNDSAAGAAGTLVILLCAMIQRRGLAWRRAALVGLFLGLGLLSKVGTLALWPLVALAIGLAWWLGPDRRRAWPAALGQAALAWGLGLLIASPWLVRNWRLYGDPLAWDLVRATVDQRMGTFVLRDLGWLLAGFHRTFWGRFGGAGQIELPPWAQAVAALFTLVVILGAVRFVISIIKQSRNSAIPHFLLLSAAPLLTFLSVVRYSAIALGTDQARLMFPALAAMAVWVGVGLVGLVRNGGIAEWRDCGMAERRLVIGFTAGMAVFGAAVLVGLIRPGFAPPEPVDQASAPAGPALAVFGDGLELLAVELPDRPLAAGEPAPVRLLWRASRPLGNDLRLSLRLVHADGWLAAEWSHSPAGGRYPTDRWQPGEVIADDYLIAPRPAAPGTYQVELGVRPFGGDWLLAEPTGIAGAGVVVGEITYQ
jgi:4-amino-4-deoxy-L-arabinose transferase-like glycosyltransferase